MAEYGKDPRRERFRAIANDSSPATRTRITNGRVSIKAAIDELLPLLPLDAILAEVLERRGQFQNEELQNGRTRITMPRTPQETPEQREERFLAAVLSGAAEPDLVDELEARAFNVNNIGDRKIVILDP